MVQLFRSPGAGGGVTPVAEKLVLAPVEQEISADPSVVKPPCFLMYVCKEKKTFAKKILL